MCLGRPVDMWSLGVITFILLGGYPPFVDRDQKNMYRRIVSARYQFHEQYWNQVSDQAKDFIKRLLVADPNERLTADQALVHPWFMDNGNLMHEEHLRDNFEQLKVFNLKRKLRAAVYAVIATNKLTSLGIHFNTMMMDVDAD